MAAEKNHPNSASPTAVDKASQHNGERRRKVAEAAYYRAERRGFAPGGEDTDWLAAEHEIGAWQGSIKVDELNKCLK